ncbi:MAG: hypothetical protein EU552_01910 [Promethearchaeota archaeon]|nr:MAG: hypothetical protein EU552_01910 [Candidatus Lokiarchaeota archaeon]
MKKLSEYNLKTITIMQLLIACAVSLLFQFVIPMAWQPLYFFGSGPNVRHFDEGANIVIFTVSQWYFSLAIAWFIKRDNPYINNFLVYSLIGLIITIFTEIVSYGLFYDYYHIIPFGVSIYIFWKKRDTLYPKYVIHNSIFITIWLLLVYFLRLAYFQAPIIDYLVRLVLIVILGYVLAYIIKYLKKRDNKE